MTPGTSLSERLASAAMVGVLLCAIPYETTGSSAFDHAAGAFFVLGLASFAPRMNRTLRVFVAICLALVLMAAAFDRDWTGTALAGLSRASFIAAFFVALTAIRNAAMTDPSILNCGRFLAAQPPGRRYAALTLGGHLFGMVLGYGSISLLGALASEAAGREPDPEIRAIRTRRMLVAVQRGFASMLPWWPLAFSNAIALTVVPSARWIDVAPLTFVSALLIAGLGWAMDTIFKPRLSAPPPPRGPAEGQWLLNLRPLFLLMAVILGAVGLLHFTADLRVAGAVIAIAPALATAWVAFQPAARGARAATAAARVAEFTGTGLQSVMAELALVAMGGFIGVTGAALIAPLASDSGLDLAALPVPVLLVCLVWLIPVTGQLGMNPILAVSLFGPLLPDPAAIGVPPALVVAAITSGWALSGLTSPYTASVLMIATYGRVRPLAVGLRWNGGLALICGAVLSAWVAVLSFLL